MWRERVAERANQWAQHRIDVLEARLRTLKRAAVLFGVGRYLYALSAVWAALDVYVLDSVLVRLREGLAH